MNGLGPAQHDCFGHRKSPSGLQPGQLGLTVKVSYTGCCLKSQGKDVKPEDKVGLLRWNAALSALPLDAGTLQLATVQSFQANSQISLSTVPFSNQGPVTALGGISSLVPGLPS